MKRRAAFFVLNVSICAGGEQHIDEEPVALICSQMKGCAAFFVLNVRIRAGSEQQINDTTIALFDCQVEGCLAIKVIPCVNFLTSLRVLDLFNNNLTSLPAEIGQLASLKRFYFSNKKLMSVPASIINELRARGCNVST
jgi:hypothetical protein